MRLFLTELAIKKLPFSEQTEKYWDTRLPGFGVRVGKRAKTYIYSTGRARQIRKIGRFGEISLSEARQQAKQLQGTVLPKKRCVRLPELVTAFLQDCETRLRPSSVQRYRDILKKAPDIEVADATRALAKTAHEIKSYKAMFNFALREEWHDRNPFHYVSAVYNTRDRVLSDEELKRVWQFENPPFSNIVKLLILTGQRRSQIGYLRADWIGEDKVTFPTHIMKQGKAHSIPIGEMSRPLLKPYWFNAWSKSKQMLDKEAEVFDWRLHDLRRTFATAHARIGTPIHVVEALLAHTSGKISGVTAIYIRHQWQEEMREATQAYETWLKSKVLAG